LKSPDDKTRQAAEEKLKEMAKQAQANADAKNPPAKKDAPKLDEKQAKEFRDAVKDLTSPDKQKQADAQQKLDDLVGKENRKEIEQVMNDLKSDDKAKRDAAQKKLDDWKKEAEKLANKDGKGPKKGGKGDKGKEPTPEEIADLVKKAQDLQSKDDDKRKQAEKDLDEKLGKEARERLQEELKNQKPGEPMMDAEKLKKQIEEEMAKNPPKKEDFEEWWKGLGTSTESKGPMEDDKRNRLKSAERNLEEFEKRRYDEALRKTMNWTDEEHQRFLDGYRKYVENLRNEVINDDKKPGALATEPGSPFFKGPTSGKVEGKTGDSSGTVTTKPDSPPGFEDARRRFNEALKGKDKK
jgi:collagen type III alpha